MNIKNLNYTVENWKKGRHCTKCKKQSKLSKTPSVFIHLVKRHLFSCTIMILENLLSPEWISISCNDAIISDIVCMNENHIIHKGVNINNTQKKQKTVFTTFLCPDGEYISSSRQCNGVNDCSNNADETNFFCFFKGTRVDNSFFCKYFCQQPICMCQKLLFQGNYAGCHFFEDKSSDTLFQKTYSRDPDQKQSFDLETVNKQSSDYCHRKSNLSLELCNEPKYCYQDHPIRSYIKQECIYKLNEEGNLETCRNGKHLEQCIDFNCESVGKYKCPGYYCFPMTYVCNGKIDCPRGLDESGCENYKCEKLLRCLNTIQCIYIENVCDGVKDCPYGDDEVNCILNEYTCPIYCSCQILAISCWIENGRLSGQLILLKRMLYIFIIGNPFITYFAWSLYLHKVRSLNLHYFNLPDICSVFEHSFKKYSSLIALVISRNQINFLRSHCLNSQINMVVLNISRNNIREIKDLAFICLKHLHVIDLSHNKMTSINEQMFLGIENIIFFRFYGNDLKTIDIMTFKHMISIKLIVASDYRICCIKPCSNTICNITYLPKESNSCQGLITNNITITIMFIFAFALITINMISLHRVKAFNMQSTNQATCFGIIAKYLHLSDLSCAIYISFIAVGNTYYKISATDHGLYWRRHLVCYLSCMLYTYFQMASSGVILFLVLTRWLVAKYPLASKFKNISFTTLCLRYISMTLLIFSVSLTLLYIFNSDLYLLPNSFCTIFYDTMENRVSQFISLLLGFIHLNASVFIIVLHLLLYIASHNSLNVLKSDSKLLSLRRMASQIIFVTFCKFTC